MLPPRYISQVSWVSQVSINHTFISWNIWLPSPPILTISSKYCIISSKGGVSFQSQWNSLSLGIRSHQQCLPLLLRLCLKIRWLLTCDRLRLSQASTSGSHRILRKRLCYHQQFLPLLLRIYLTNFCTLHLRILSNTQNCLIVVYISRFNLIGTWILWIDKFLLKTNGLKTLQSLVVTKALSDHAWAC